MSSFPVAIPRGGNSGGGSSSGSGGVNTDSPSFTGSPTAPTPLVGDSSNLLATTSFVSLAIASITGGPPSNLNTIKELADAINDDPNYSTTITTSLSLKAPINSPNFTGSPTVPALLSSDNSAKIANTSFVNTAISTVLGSVPTTLNTLQKIAAAINNDPNFVTTINNLITLRAGLDSPTFTGTPTVPTPLAGDNTGKIANTAFVSTAIAALVNAAPGTLNTLKELADAIGDDPNYATTVATALGLKAPLASPALTGTPTAPTAIAGNNTTQLSTTAFVTAAINALIGAAPTGLNNLQKIATALNNDATYASTISTALSGKAPLASPAFTGVPTVPNVVAGDNSVTAANTAFVVTAVANAIAALVGTAPTALNTLQELATAIGNDPAFSTTINTTITNGLSVKAPIASPAFTGNPTAPTLASGNSSTGLATTAFVANAVAGVVSSGGGAPVNSPAFTGTPTAPTPAVGDNTTTLATTAFVGESVLIGVNISRWPGVVTGAQITAAQRTNNGTAINQAIQYCLTNKLPGFFDGVVHEFMTSTGKGIYVPGGTFRTTMDAYFIQFGTNEAIITLGNDTNDGTYTKDMLWEGGWFGYGVDQTGQTNANAIVLGKHFNSKFSRMNHSSSASISSGSTSSRFLPYRALWLKGSNGQGGSNFFFSCEVSEMRLDHAQQAIIEVTVQGTDNKFKRIYLGGGTAGSQQVYSGSGGAPLVINVNGTNSAVIAGIWEEINIEWVSSHYIGIMLGCQGMTCLNWHIEGVVLTGFSPTLFNVTGSTLQFIGGEWLDIYIKAANSGGGTTRLFYAYSGASVILNDVQLHWSTTVGPPDMSWVLWQPDGGQPNNRQNFRAYNMNLAADSGNIVGFNFDAVVGTSNSYGDVKYFGEYVYHPTLPTVKEAGIFVVDASYTAYGLLEKQHIYYNSAITANRTVTLSPYMTSTGSGNRLLRRTGDIVRVVRNSTSTGAFNIVVVDHLGNVLSTISAASTQLDFTFDGNRFQLASTAVAGLNMEVPSANATETLSITNLNTTRVYSQACAVTLPNNLPAGFKIELVQNSAGPISVVAASGATVTSTNGNLSSTYQGARLRIECISNTSGTAAVYVLNGDLVSEFAPNIVSATTYAFVLADRSRTTLSTSTSATTYTLPANATVPFPIGAVIRVIENGTGAVTIAPASGVTINKLASKSLTITGQYGKLELTQTAIDTWVLNGDT